MLFACASRFTTPCRQLLILLASFSLSLFIAASANAATYYVATNGSDNNPGTQVAPFKTFAEAVDKLRPGDTLYIRGGLYTERLDFQGPNISGTASGWITVAGYPGEAVTIRYADTLEGGYGPIKARGNRGYFIFQNLILDGSDMADEVKWQIRDGNHHFILRNIEMKNFPTSNLLVKADNITIQNSILRDGRSNGEVGKRGYGIYYSGSNGLIEGNEIYNQVGGGMQAYPGPVNNLIIRNNNIHDNNTTVHSAVGGILIAGKNSTVSNVSVYNNLIYNNGSSPSSGSATGIRVDDASTSGIKVWNNTVYNNKGYGISMNQSANTAVQNNIVFGNAKGGIVDYGTGTTISNNLTSNPLFINPSAGDFGVQASSPAIDKGITLAAVSDDFTGKKRPEGAAYDIGAFEGAGSRADAIPAVGGGIPTTIPTGGTGGIDHFGLGNCLK